MRSTDAEIARNRLSGFWRSYRCYLARAIKAEKRGFLVTAKYYHQAAETELNRYFASLEHNFDVLARP